MDAYKRSFWVVLLCVFFVNYAAAWGETTQEYICRSAVEKAWGKALADKCLAPTAGNKENLCSLIGRIRGEEEYASCMNHYAVHPALVPYLVFNDSALHYNYESCPLPKSDAQLRSWACNTSGRNLAMEQASFWLNAMNESVGCDRIYRFCIGSNYFSDSFMPLYQLMYATPASVEEMDDRVDKLISEDKKPWGIDVSAAFQARSKPRSVRKFEVNSRMFDDIIGRLAAAAGKQPESSVQPVIETCSDGIRNQGESGVDCGGPCKPCEKPVVESCLDGIRNQGETGVDCGGPCVACPQPEKGGWSIPEYVTQAIVGLLIIVVIFLLLAATAVVAVTILKSRKKQSPKDDEFSAKSLEELVEQPETVKLPEPPKKRPKARAEVTEKTGLDEIGDRLHDIQSTLKRLE